MPRRNLKTENITEMLTANSHYEFVPEKMGYEIAVWQDEDGTWLAELYHNEPKTVNPLITFGETEEEIWDMIADLVLTVKGVRISWWNKFLARLRRY